MMRCVIVKSRISIRYYLHEWTHSARSIVTLGKYFSFCALLPFLTIWLTQRLECAPYDSATEPDAREISSMTNVCSI